MNFLIFILYAIKYEDSEKTFYAVIISFLFGLLIPIITILKFKKDGQISDFDASIKEERTVPYIYAIFYSLIGVVLTGFLELNSYIIMLWMVYLVNSILIININHWWKISAHAMGAAMPVGALVFWSSNEFLYLSIIILFLVSLARIYLKVHTIFQVFAGSIAGFSVAFVLINYCL
jgi:membrane-associated phospholipid phosphatase